MADQPTIPSGSRWEHDHDETSETPATEAATSESPIADGPTPTDETYGATSEAAAVPPAAPLDDPAAEERRAQLRTRAILAGAATALALGGGLTGFVIGHSTAGDDNGFRPASFQRDGSGQQPGGDGQQGPPSFRDNDGDGGFGPQQDSDDDGSSSSSGTAS
jgi:hypothetical protein